MPSLVSLRTSLAVGLLGALCACTARSSTPPEVASEPGAAGSDGALGEAAASEKGDPASPAASSDAPGPRTPSGPSSSSSGPADTRTAESINAVIQANREQVRACYDRALESNPDIVGDLVVSFVIDPSGKVKSAEIDWNESDIHVPELDACATAAIRSLTFPASSRGLESQVTYPFNLNPKQVPPKASKP